MQTPSIPGAELVDKGFEVEVRRIRQQTNRQNTFYEDVVQDRLRVSVRHDPIFQVRYFAGKPPEMILESEHCMVDLGSEVEPRSVLAIQRDQIAAEDHVVADKNLQAGTYLYRHGAVVCRTHAYCCHAVLLILIR